MFELQLPTPATSFMFDHCVRGRMLVPCSTFLEAASAALQVLVFSPGQNSKATFPACSGCALATPLLLSAQFKSASIQMTTNLIAGVLKIGSPQHSASHLTCLLENPFEPHMQRQSMHSNVQPAHAHTLSIRGHCSPSIPLSKLSISTCSTLPPQGYRAHPAVVDSSFHLGALAQHQTDLSVRIPCSIEVFSAQKEFKHFTTLVTCYIRQATGNYEPVADLCMQQQSSACNEATIVCGLEARPIVMPITTNKAHRASVVRDENSAQLVYLSRWQATDVKGPGLRITCTRHSSVLSYARRNVSAEMHIKAESSFSNLVCPVLAALSKVQSVFRQGAHDACVKLLTEDALHISQNIAAKQPNLCGIASWGLMRVASAENSRAAIELIDGDGYMPGCHSPAEAAGVAGSASRQGLMLTPRLLPWLGNMSKSALADENTTLLSGKVLITGGLGGKFSSSFPAPTLVFVLAGLTVRVA